jgi:hypothetical protein
MANFTSKNGLTVLLLSTQARRTVCVSLMLSICSLPANAQQRAERKDDAAPHPTSYRSAQIDGLSIFYREAGPKKRARTSSVTRPSLLLAHV